MTRKPTILSKPQKKIEAQTLKIIERFNDAIENGHTRLANDELNLLSNLMKLSQAIAQTHSQFDPIEKRKKRDELMRELERRFERIARGENT